MTPIFIIKGVTVMSRVSKYTNEQLTLAVKDSKSVSEVMRKIGMVFAGGSHAHITKRIKNLKLDTSHFQTNGLNKGKVSQKRMASCEILVLDRLNGLRKENILKLRRAMGEYGFKKVCGECGLEEIWNGRQIVLQVDHINGNNLDNRPENLRYICPNCHSQSENYCWKNRKSKL